MAKTIALAIFVIYLCGPDATRAKTQVHYRPPYELLAKNKPFATLLPENADLDYKRIKRQTAQSIQQFQDYLTNLKESCISDMGYPHKATEKKFLFLENPTFKEKCLIQCILKRAEIMDSDNKLSVQSIGRIADWVSNKNPLVISIAMASADNCNRNISAQDPCERAHQINLCIAHEIKSHKVKLSY